MNSSRSTILNAIRKQHVPIVELPRLVRDEWIKYPHRRQQFMDAVVSVGGTTQVVSDFAEMKNSLDLHELYGKAAIVLSQVPEIDGNLDLDLIHDPHDLEHIDFAVFKGEFGVAENGAIWLDGSGLKHRVAYFIAQHLIILLDAERIYDNMHQAYEHVDFSQRQFGVFLSGPSKTADIEQALVIGAHGARSLQVFLMT